MKPVGSPILERETSHGSQRSTLTLTLGLCVAQAAIRESGVQKLIFFAGGLGLLIAIRSIKFRLADPFWAGFESENERKPSIWGPPSAPSLTRTPFSVFEASRKFRLRRPIAGVS